MLLQGLDMHEGIVGFRSSTQPTLMLSLPRVNFTWGLFRTSANEHSRVLFEPASRGCAPPGGS